MTTALVPARPRLRILLNPSASGGRAAGKREAILRWLAAADWPAEVVCTEGPGHATALAANAWREGVALLGVAGGDGTLSEVAQLWRGDLLPPAAHPPPALGLIPIGTGGDFRRTFGLSAGLEQSLLRLLHGTERPLDLVELLFEPPEKPPERRVFVNVAGPGIGGLSDELVARSPKWLGGRASYAIAALRILPCFSAPSLRVCVDGREVYAGKVMNVCLCNARYLGGGIYMAPHADPADGLLDVVVIEARPYWQAVRMTVPLFHGTHLQLPGVHVFRGREVELLPFGDGGRVVFDVDGEAMGSLPARARVLPGAARLRL